MRISPSTPSRRRALIPLLALALLYVPTQAVGAAGDPVAEAEARVTEARRAANEATQQYEDAQTTYYSLEEEIDRTRQQVAGLQRDAEALTAVATARALEAYKGDNSNLDAIMDGTNVMDAIRRGALLDRVNEKGNNAVDRLGAATEDLHVQEAALGDKLAKQEKVVSELRAKRAELQSAVEAAERAERELKARLEAERRAAELKARLDKARAAAAAASAARARPATQPGPRAAAAVAPRPSGGSVVVGGFQCPVPGASFSDTYGAPRSGGRSHQGVDMMAGYGTPIYAVVSGSASHSTSGLGGNQIWLAGSDGNRYFYAHLQSYVGGAGAVNAGDMIGKVGDTGNARGTPHLHFEIHPGGGAAVNPYPTVRAHC